MKTPKSKHYGAYVTVKLELYVPVEGGTIEEALANARKLKETGVVSVPSSADYNDGSIEVTGITEIY